MWSSWVKRKGTTQVMYIAKLKDGPKRVKKTFSMILERFLKWYDGGWENGITLKRIFEVEVFFSSQNIDFPVFEETLGAFLFVPVFSFLSLLFLSFSFFQYFFLSALSLEDLGALMIFEEKITSSKTSFQMAWHGIAWSWLWK
jgi:hypothetical protein